MQLKSFLLPALLSAVPCLALNEIPVADALMQVVYEKYNGASPLNLYKRARILRNYEDKTWTSRNIIDIVDKLGFVDHVLTLSENAKAATEEAEKMTTDLAEVKKSLDDAYKVVENLTDKEKADLGALRAKYENGVSVAEAVKRVIPTLKHWLLDGDIWEFLPWDPKLYIKVMTDQRLGNAAWEEWALTTDREHRKNRDGGADILAYRRENKRTWKDPEVLRTEEEKVALTLASDRKYLIRNTLGAVLSEFHDAFEKSLREYLVNVVHMKGEERRDSVVTWVLNKYTIHRLNAFLNFDDLNPQLNPLLKGVGKNKGFGVNELIKKGLPMSRVKAVEAAAKEQSVEKVGIQRLKKPVVGMH